MTTTPLTYFVQFRNADGSLVTGAGGQTWFAVTDLSGASLQSLNLGGTSSTSSGSGSLVFEPTSITIGSDPALATLFADFTAGTAFEQVEVAGYSVTGNTAVLVQDTVLKGATIFTDTTMDGGTVLDLQSSDQVERSYSATGVQTSVDGYNTASSTTDTGTNTISGAPGYAPTANGTTAPNAVADSTQTYFVQIRTASGSVITAADGQTWFAVTGVSVPALNTAASGATPALSFALASFTVTGAALPPLLQQEAAGTSLTVELAGYDGTGATAALRSDILLKSASIASITAGSDGSDTVAISTTDVVQSDAPPAGTPGLDATAGYDTTATQADSSAATAASPLGSPSVTAGPALTYYVQFLTPAGTKLTGDGGDSWFAVQALSGGTAHASGSSTLTYDPLQITLSPDSILTTLFARQAAGQAVGVEIAGYTASGTLAEDDVYTVASTTAATTNPNGTETLSIAPTGASQTQYGTGLLGLPQTVTSSWSTANGGNSTLTNATAPSAPASPPTVSATDPALTYYVQFRNAAGTLLAGTGGATWFAVTDVSFATDNTAHASFGGLSFTLGADSVLPTLFGIETVGTTLASVELAGYAVNGSSATLTTDDLFKLDLISGFTSQADGSATVSLSSRDVLQTSDVAGTSGSVQQAASGWNYSTEQADNTTTVPGIGTYGLDANRITIPAAASDPATLTYFVRFTPFGTTTPLTTAAGASWFSISDLSLDSSNPGAATGAAGKTNFDGVSFTLNDPLLQPSLFIAEASSTAYGQVEVAGYNTSGSTPVLVEDHILDQAQITDLQNGGQSSLDVSLQYATDVEQSYTTSASGTVSLAATRGYDVATQKSTTAVTDPVAATLSGEPANVSAPVSLSYFIGLTPYSSTDSTLFTADGKPIFYSVTDVSYETTQSTDIGSQSSGAGSGKITFDPLSFTLVANSPLLPTLLALEGSGTAFKTAELAGYDADGSTTLRVSDAHFELAAINSIVENADGTETVKLEYGALQETAAGLTASSTTTTNTDTWDDVTNSSDDSTYTVASGTALTAEPADGNACYCGGTLILTVCGEVAVEDLAIGDTAVTWDGKRRPVKWIGRRSYAGRFLAANPNVQPIRFRAGSLGGSVPRRDLLVSPQHAMFLDGVLIPARCLVNGSTIVRDRVERVDYFHVELDSHDVLLAEGAPSESFLDDDSRGMFHNAAEYAALYPDAPAPSGFCAPRVESGRQLEAIRQRLVAIADEVTQAA